MPESPSNADRPKQRVRPWYRLHVSTCIVLALLAALLVILNVRGDTRDPRMDYHLVDWLPPDPYRDLQGFSDSRADESQHGWPFTYLRRQWRFEPTWLHPQRKYVVFAAEFSRADLAVDIVVVMFILVLVGVAVEWRRRRRENVWQFRLWELLALFVVVAASLGWWQTHRQRYRREYEAILAICYEDFSEFAPLDLDPYADFGHFETAYCGPAWLRKLIPHDCLTLFRSVVSIELGTPASDLALERLRAHLKCLPNLRCTRVSVLDVDGDSKLTNAGLVHLRELPGLEVVYLEDLPLANDILPYLAGLRSLRAIDLSGTQVNNDGLKYVAQLERLSYLDLSGTAVSNAGLARLRKLENLKYLDLCKTQVSDEGLKYLSDLQELRELFLFGTAVSDAGLVHLRQLRNLELLYVDETQVTPGGTSQLEKVLPNCIVLVPEPPDATAE